MKYDVAIIGGGPAGYTAAEKAAAGGLSTVLFEKNALGGVCLNEGCVPTKTLLYSAKVFDTIKHAPKYAVSAENPAFDFPKIIARKNKVVKKLTAGIRMKMKENGVEVVSGEAEIKGRAADGTIAVASGEVVYEAANLLICTGSETVIPPIPGLAETEYWTSREALLSKELPASLVIIGGGVIGVEFAYLLNRLGSKVTVLELMDHILPMVDIEVSRLAEKRMTKDGILFRLGAKVSRVKDDTVYYEFGGQNCQVKSDMVLMAVGRVPNTQGLNAKGIGIEFDRKAIRTDAHMRTNIPHIYAIGDVNGKVMLAHTASHEGMVAVADICGQGEEMRYDRIPSCVYLEPEIACIGLTEAQAREKYGDGLKIGRFNMAANGKSLIAGDTDGLFKVIVAADTGEILGAHLYGQHVTDMIGEISAAMAAEGTAEELIHAIHPHPTVNEALGEAFMAAWNGRAINSL